MNGLINKKLDNLTVKSQNDLVQVAENLMMDTRSVLDEKKQMSVPIAELATLGAGVASLIPAFNTVTTNMTISADGLYRVVNQATGDVLKMAKNGDYWGALKTAEGGSKMARLAKADSITATSQSVAAINPATLMMAVALYSIEKRLGEIEDTQRKMLSLLKIEDESGIEGDLETLTELITNYKHNWDNPVYVQNSHKMVMDLKRSARRNMNSYQRKIEELLASTNMLVASGTVESSLKELENRFKYYRISLYTYALAAMMEIMLGGNFKEEYINSIKGEISNLSTDYRDLFEKGSCYLEELSNSQVEVNVLSGIGAASEAIGKLIGSIPIVKEGPVDEFLQDEGTRLKESATGMKTEALHRFAALSNPGTSVFIDKMEDLIQIYNHTEHICFDDKRIYLVK